MNSRSISFYGYVQLSFQDYSIHNVQGSVVVVEDVLLYPSISSDLEVWSPLVHSHIVALSTAGSQEEFVVCL